MSTVSLDFQFDSPIEKIWSALTDSKKLAKWVMDNDFRPIVGYECRFWTEPNKFWDGIVHSKVLIVNEPNKLSYTWLTDGQNTVVTWTLKKHGEKTHLHLEHEGFENEGHAYQGAKQGWAKMVNQLNRLIEQ